MTAASRASNMTELTNEFDRIAKLFVLQNDDVQHGKMMSSPALKCSGKVFAFHGRDGMGFRLGPEFDPRTCGLKNPKPLNPFKTKPPLKGWVIVDGNEKDKWEAVAAKALEYTRTLAP